MSVCLKNSKNICLRIIFKHGDINQGKDKKISRKRKWTDMEYHVKDNADVAQKDVKIYCDTNQFPKLPFCGSHPKPHGARGLVKHYHLRFDPNLGNGICEILRITCACVACTLMLDKSWISGYATNLSPTIIIGKYWDHITIGISLS